MCTELDMGFWLWKMGNSFDWFFVYFIWIQSSVKLFSDLIPLQNWQTTENRRIWFFPPEREHSVCIMYNIEKNILWQVIDRPQKIVAVEITFEVMFKVYFFYYRCFVDSISYFHIKWHVCDMNYYNTKKVCVYV